eukprot:15436978-Alexandrium_andersonii.AAC.1
MLRPLRAPCGQTPREYTTRANRPVSAVSFSMVGERLEFKSCTRTWYASQRCHNTTARERGKLERGDRCLSRQQK